MHIYQECFITISLCVNGMSFHDVTESLVAAVCVFIPFCDVRENIS